MALKAAYLALMTFAKSIYPYPKISAPWDHSFISPKVAYMYMPWFLNKVTFSDLQGC